MLWLLLSRGELCLLLSSRGEEASLLPEDECTWSLLPWLLAFRCLFSSSIAVIKLSIAIWYNSAFWCSTIAAASSCSCPCATGARPPAPYIRRPKYIFWTNVLVKQEPRNIYEESVLLLRRREGINMNENRRASLVVSKFEWNEKIFLYYIPGQDVLDSPPRARLLQFPSRWLIGSDFVRVPFGDFRKHAAKIRHSRCSPCAVSGHGRGAPLLLWNGFSHSKSLKDYLLSSIIFLAEALLKVMNLL